MAIDFNKPVTTETAAPAANDRPKAMLWLNVGKSVTIKNEQGEDESMFVSTPIGLPLDTMQPMKGRSKLALFKNAFLEQLQQACLTIEPGHSEIVNGLEVQMTRGSTEAPQATDSDQAVISQLKIKFG